MRDYKDIKPWSDVTKEQWDDWRWQIKNRITDTKTLKKVISISTDEEEEINACLNKFRMAITPYYASLIDQDNPNCPIKAQCIPDIRELTILPYELSDPLDEDGLSPVPNIVHRYPDRVLFLLTNKCSMYCRHCTRRRMVGQEDCDITYESFEQAVEYIKSNKNIRDVLLSGGDPFILSDEFLERIISILRDIPHVEIIRIGTRTPVVLPMRITDELLAMLKKYQPIWINTHFNHPNEITEYSIQACEKIVDAGIPLGNQTVLLKGVNDDKETIKELFLKLVKMRVRPYYLYQCDLSQGIWHFRTSVEAGVDIMRSLRGYISGYAVPTFVMDAPGGGGKIPINPEYVVDIDDRDIVMKNYKGDIYTYPNIH
ncbi:lysine 2,3-aminomutase [Xylanivirga thermophila]|uniref:lysine 2,3-aminomutase n=1 Tax=Xylanivirga thermophila TaxID=2496273 RepID=UPI00101B670C|nr:lysine 2,3-aminomutase [Xylanivirga thermophila]